MIVKNPTWKEYFRVRAIDGYVRGLYDPGRDDLWIWRGDRMHKDKTGPLGFDREEVLLFVLKPHLISNIRGPEHARARALNRLKELEPRADVEKIIGDVSCH